VSTLTERELILREAAKIVDALGQTLAPMCEVVLHDLSRPNNAIVKIENNLSGRSPGGPATELGLARIADPDFPDILANYENRFSDGRPAKSTSIGLKDSDGNFVAAICLNMEVSYFRSIASYFQKIAQTNPLEQGRNDTIISINQPTLASEINSYAASCNKDPRSLTSDEKCELVGQLSQKGYLERRGAAEQIAQIIGSSRSSIYYYLDRDKKAKLDCGNS
jgi:predicted transcriptional regulator YheO